MIRPDPIAAEIRAAIERRKGIKRQAEPIDPRAVERRKKIAEIEEKRRLREQTEWL